MFNFLLDKKHISNILITYLAPKKPKPKIQSFFNNVTQSLDLFQLVDIS